MKYRKLKRAAGIILSAALLVGTLAGCGGKGKTETDGQKKDGGSGESSSEEDGGASAMGRFLEEDISFPIPLGNVYDMKKLEDGTIRVLASNGDNEQKEVWDSKDTGANWEKAYDFPAELQNGAQGYMDYAVLSSNGQAVCAYNEIGDNGIKSILYLVSNEGNANKVAFELAEKKGEQPAGGESSDSSQISNMIWGLQALGSDQVLVRDTQDTVYQVNLTDGSVKHTYDFGGQSGTQTPYIVGNKMIVASETEVLLYDTETGEQQTSEEALQSSSLENGLIQAVDTMNAGESFYFLNSSGLYHYKFGGSVAEQLIDGGMNSIGAPSFEPIALTMTDEQNLLVAANDPFATSGLGVSLLKYTYSADTPAKPEKEMKVYSLYENRELGQAISRFQKEYTDVYANYQVALTEENGVTVSDALKTLTTEIMAGKGPDVLVLDGMPVDTYIEKGILKDLSSVIGEDGNNYFEDILNAYKGEKGLCAVPARFIIPMAQGGSAYYNPGEDFDTFTARKDVLKNMDPQSVVEKFWYSCGAAWKKEDGTLDQAKITGFLTKLKNAYGEYDNSMDAGDKTYEIDKMLQLSLAWKETELAGGKLNVNIGLYNRMDYGMMQAVLNKVENGDYGLMPGQAEKVFVPAMIMGISSKSNQPEPAEQFVKYLFAKEAQTISQSGGFPVQREAFLSVIDGHQYEGKESFVAVGDSEGGELLDYQRSPTPQEEIKKFTDLAESLSTPALQDDVIKEAVTEQGTKVLKGELSPEEAVNEIMQKVNIYLAE